MRQIGWMVATLTALATGQAPTDDNIYILTNVRNADHKGTVATPQSSRWTSRRTVQPPRTRTISTPT
jgi:hypothetical protein